MRVRSLPAVRSREVSEGEKRTAVRVSAVLVEKVRLVVGRWRVRSQISRVFEAVAKEGEKR